MKHTTLADCSWSPREPQLERTGRRRLALLFQRQAARKVSHVAVMSVICTSHMASTEEKSLILFRPGVGVHMAVRERHPSFSMGRPYNIGIKGSMRRGRADSYCAFVVLMCL